MTEPLSRTSVLASRHTALGSGLEDWNGMGTPWGYATDPCDEHDAIREAAGMFDVSPLKKIRVRGADATAVIDHVLTRDMSNIPPGKSAYAPVLTDRGTIADDAIAANLGDDGWLFVHGTGGSMEMLQESAEGKNVSVELDDDLHDISLQGPKALELLDQHTPADLSSLAYFHQVDTELFGRPVTISRTGYSGERGYEIFVTAAHAPDIWDNILEHGADMGIMPTSFAALDKVRVEAALLFYPYDMTDDHTPWEVGLDWALSRKKDDFRGRDAVFAAEGKERFRVCGISVDHDEALEGGETLSVNGAEVGTVISPAYSHRMGKSLALVHLGLDSTASGTELEVAGDGVSYNATVESIPFLDPQKAKTHA